MFKIEKRTEVKEYYTGFVCDKCKTEVNVDDVIE